MNQEILHALYLVYEIVAEQYDDMCEEAIDNNVESHRIMGDQLALVFEYLLQQERLLALKELEATERNN